MRFQLNHVAATISAYTVACECQGRDSGSECDSTGVTIDCGICTNSPPPASTKSNDKADYWPITNGPSDLDFGQLDMSVGFVPLLTQQTEVTLEMAQTSQLNQENISTGPEHEILAPQLNARY